MRFLHVNLPFARGGNAAVRSLMEVLGHTDSEAAGTPTGRDRNNCESAREGILRPAEEGVRPEKMSARRVARSMESG